MESKINVSKYGNKKPNAKNGVKQKVPSGGTKFSNGGLNVNTRASAGKTHHSKYPNAAIGFNDYSHVDARFLHQNQYFPINQQYANEHWVHQSVVPFQDKNVHTIPNVPTVPTAKKPTSLSLYTAMDKIEECNAKGDKEVNYFNYYFPRVKDTNDSVKICIGNVGKSVHVRFLFICLKDMTGKDIGRIINSFGDYELNRMSRRYCNHNAFEFTMTGGIPNRISLDETIIASSIAFSINGTTIFAQIQHGGSLYFEGYEYSGKYVYIDHRYENNNDDKSVNDTLSEGFENWSSHGDDTASNEQLLVTPNNFNGKDGFDQQSFTCNVNGVDDYNLQDVDGIFTSNNVYANDVNDKDGGGENANVDNAKGGVVVNANGGGENANVDKGGVNNDQTVGDDANVDKGGVNNDQTVVDGTNGNGDYVLSDDNQNLNFDDVDDDANGYVGENANVDNAKGGVVVNANGGVDDNANDYNLQLVNATNGIVNGGVIQKNDVDVVGVYLKTWLDSLPNLNLDMDMNMTFCVCLSLCVCMLMFCVTLIIIYK